MKTLKAFIQEHKITLSDIRYVDSNPHMISEQRMNHYKVTLRNRSNRRQFTLYFSMGLGLSGKPEVADILDCVAMDSVSVENARNFSEWTSEFGYSEDDSQAKRTYEVCQRQAEKLRKFIGKGYSNLLFKTERL